MLSTKAPMDEQKCRDQMDVLRIDMRSIEIQLGDRNRVDPETWERMVVKKYWEWRHKAMFALSCKQEEFILLKNWLKERRDRDIEKTLADALVKMRTGDLTRSDMVYCLEVSPYLRKIYKPEDWRCRMDNHG